jgi:23S rRNA pseudouridine1911/1915/1917 synthase
MQSIGHPLIGDATYGGSRAPVRFGRQALHAWRLALDHPRTKARMSWQSDPPDDLRTLAVELGFDLDVLLGTRAHDG